MVGIFTCEIIVLNTYNLQLETVYNRITIFSDLLITLAFSCHFKHDRNKQHLLVKICAESLFCHILMSECICGHFPMVSLSRQEEVLCERFRPTIVLRVLDRTSDLERIKWRNFHCIRLNRFTFWPTNTRHTVKNLVI